MKFTIKHEITGRLRVHFGLTRMTFRQADILEYYLVCLPFVKKAVVYENTADAVILFSADRMEMIAALRAFHFEDVSVPETVLESSSRAINAAYKDKLISKVLGRVLRRLFLPAPVRAVYTLVHAVKYIAKGARSLAGRKLDVSVLDATAITVSILRRDLGTASSVMFLLGIGELMEEWTHKKSVCDLAQSMSLKIENVWLKTEDSEILVPADQIRPGDRVVVHMGSVIPFDGEVTDGEGMVNQASMTGEPLAVRRTVHGSVYAGTVLEEGELTVRVREIGGASRYEKIISVIEETEKLKSAMESRTEHLADRLVPYTLAGTGLVWLFTRNITRALAVLMVDFSCALKLAMPITVLSAIREAGEHHITVKGGKYLEAMAEAKTIVFDKTGTLTRAVPVVREVISFTGEEPDELLRIAACLEEHFPHSMAKAVVKAAADKGLVHDEMHTKIEYIVAHGIASDIDGKRVLLGSRHFVFEDESTLCSPEEEEKLSGIPAQYSRLYMAVDHRLAAVICVEDPVRPDAAHVVEKLRAAGFEKIVMMTGDSENSAAAVAACLKLDEFYAEVLPEQKAEYVQKEKALGHTVVMIGDGINDAPALSAADVGIAISDGAQIAREIADITISADDLGKIVTLKQISNAMMKRVNGNYRGIVGINGSLIGLGVAGVIAPTVSATLHNLSTIGISLHAMTRLLPEEEDRADMPA